MKNNVFDSVDYIIVKLRIEKAGISMLIADIDQVFDWTVRGRKFDYSIVRFVLILNSGKISTNIITGMRYGCGEPSYKFNWLLIYMTLNIATKKKKKKREIENDIRFSYPCNVIFDSWGRGQRAVGNYWYQIFKVNCFSFINRKMNDLKWYSFKMILN